MTEKRAFTLVEMLIVIAIVSILAMIAVSSFGAARQQARREIAIDSMVSALRGQQTLAKSGRLDEGLDNRCYGMLFLTEEPYVQIVDMLYVPVGTDNRADYCDELQTNLNVRDFDVIEDFEVRDIERFGSVGINDVLVIFKPPFAHPIFGNKSFSFENFNPSGNSDIVVSIGLPNDEEVRAFRFDTSSGLIERVYESNT